MDIGGIGPSPSPSDFSTSSVDSGNTGLCDGAGCLSQLTFYRYARGLFFSDRIVAGWEAPQWGHTTCALCAAISFRKTWKARPQ